MLLKFPTYYRPVLIVSCIITLLCSTLHSSGQQKDSLVVTGDAASLTITKKDTTLEPRKDSVKKRVYNPRTAAIRSAILPGLGQIYNRKYWKLGLVYGALGVTGYVFFDNLKTYKESRFAYAARIKASTAPFDSTDYNKLSFQYQQLYTVESIKANRDQFRRYIDYSVLIFILLWGLNVVDATVDAHLKSFDVSPDLALRFKAGHSEMAGTNGVSLVLTLKNRYSK
ncbi:MAG: hypothetical protein JWM28_176 [Chitinophagaceae bacterium]|nr:hypothetical protein [Chitinophagaceae bacterium]